MSNKWQLWIDTGGTFTDCISHSPTGERQRIKVLSNGVLRGSILEKVTKSTYRFEGNWQTKQAIFEGYQFYLLQDKSKQTCIQSIDFQRSILTLQADWEISLNSTFEITAQEEAPLLAARIATNTPLNTPLPDLDMRLGTTKGTNALLERQGAKVTLLMTKGFRDLLYIGTQQRPHLFQLNIPEPDLLYDQVIDVNERLASDGKVVLALQEQEIARVIEKIENEVVAVAFLHSYLNSSHELLMQQALAKQGIQYLSVSHQLSPNIQLLPRANTALINAYLQPTVAQYLERIRAKLSDRSSLKVMTSAGGLVSDVFFQPKDSLLSGPSGGIIGAATIAKKLNIPRILTLDMGGTSTDTARFDGEQYDYETVTKVGDAVMLSPSLSIETVAAGGGSICWFDGKKLQVGPKSTGASPGPACYGAGGDLSITDINLLLGKLDSSAMGIPIDEAAAESALSATQSTIAQQTGEQTGEQIERLTLLRGFEQIANEKMAEAIRKISVAKGFDVRDYALLVFGGAGGLHACKIAELLDIRQIILPFEGGLLSAYGMGMAQIERLAERQIIEPLEVVATRLPNIIEGLKMEAFAQLETENISKDDLYVKSILIYARLRGQDSSLPIEWSKKQFAEDFKIAYQQLFGHFPTDSIIEVESVKVRVANQQKADFSTSQNTTPQLAKPHHFKQLSHNKKLPVYFWEALEKGTTIESESILVNQTSSVFLEKNWQAVVADGKDLIVQFTPQKDFSAKKEQRAESIDLELFTNRFSSIAQEMGVQLQRTAFSVNIKERLDFSCALLDPEARLLVNAPHIPVHLGSLGICARLTLEKKPLEAGDVVMVNHPKYGGSHLPDVTLLQAVFSDKKERIGYVINRAHHAEIGGSTPGSMPPNATTLEEEGVVIVPTYLVKKGIPQWELVKKLFMEATFPTRSLAENLADLNAALASLKTGETKLKQLFQQHGIEKVHHYMNRLQEVAADILNDALLPYRGQVLEAEESLDDGHTIRLKITIQKGSIRFDFTGTDAPHPRNLNANISIVYSAILYVLRLLCAKELPLNEGLMRQVKVDLPNSFLHPHFEDDPTQSPAVVGGNTEVSQRLVDTLLKAFGLAACSQGTMNNFLFGNDHFSYYETICGGTGAGDGFHGRSAVHQHMTNTKITDPEIMELRYPVRLHEFSVRTGSGGSGKWKGGDGIVRIVEFLEVVNMTLISQHRIVAPYGLSGGGNGQIGEQFLEEENRNKEKLAGIESRRCEAGQRVIICTPGGGGFGE